MFSRVRIAIRFFFVGLAVGILLAPRSGEETRRLVRAKADRLLNDVLDAATLGTYESGAGAIEPNDEADDEGAPKPARSSDGSSRSRTTRTTRTTTPASEAGV
jgi:hypothetical protein